MCGNLHSDSRLELSKHIKSGNCSNGIVEPCCVKHGSEKCSSISKNVKFQRIYYRIHLLKNMHMISMQDYLTEVLRCDLLIPESAMTVKFVCSDPHKAIFPLPHHSKGGL